MVSHSPEWLAFVRPPAGDLSSCELVHQDRIELRLVDAQNQHAAYVKKLEALGVEVRQLDPLPDHPDAAFVEDCAIVLAEAAIIPIPGASSRRGEVQSVARALGEHRPLLEMTAPATLDGGDVLAVDETLYVGWSSRTNHAGLKSLAHLVLELGLRVKAIEVGGALHLKTAASDLGEGRLLVNPRRLELERVTDLELIAVPVSEPQGANVLRIGTDVILPDSAPRTADLLSDLGLTVHPLCLTTFEAMEAGPTCLSVLVRQYPAGVDCGNHN
ncbi:MAG: dimethylargininase [Planctomycetota bacterium]|jgi:dimethylargininase